MIGPGTGVRVYLACGVTDMRKGIVGLAALAQDHLHQKPTEPRRVCRRLISISYAAMTSVSRAV